MLGSSGLLVLVKHYIKYNELQLATDIWIWQTKPDNLKKNQLVQDYGSFISFKKLLPLDELWHRIM